MFSEAGDSIAASDGGDAAVAAGTPLQQRSERQTSPILRTQLTQERLEYWQQSQRILGEHQGNIGFMFGNWGTLPAKPNERKRVLMQVKRIPAQIVCLAEAQELVEQTLRSPPSSTGAQAADADALEGRAEFEYLVIRGREDSSLLMAVRANVARDLECLYWERRFEGVYKEKRRCYSRCMVGKVSLDKTVGHFDKEITIMCIHMHNVLANGHWSSRLVGFWD
jgi:hypothetical protein